MDGPVTDSPGRKVKSLGDLVQDQPTLVNVLIESQSDKGREFVDGRSYLVVFIDVICFIKFKVQVNRITSEEF
jgi:hypothetical protein